MVQFSFFNRSSKSRFLESVYLAHEQPMFERFGVILGYICWGTEPKCRHTGGCARRHQKCQGRIETPELQSLTCLPSWSRLAEIYLSDNANKDRLISSMSSTRYQSVAIKQKLGGKAWRGPFGLGHLPSSHMGWDKTQQAGDCVMKTESRWLGTKVKCPKPK